MGTERRLKLVDPHFEGGDDNLSDMAFTAPPLPPSGASRGQSAMNEAIVNRYLKAWPETAKLFLQTLANRRECQPMHPRVTAEIAAYLAVFIETSDEFIDFDDQAVARRLRRYLSEVRPWSRYRFAARKLSFAGLQGHHLPMVGEPHCHEHLSRLVNALSVHHNLGEGSYLNFIRGFCLLTFMVTLERAYDARGGRAFVYEAGLDRKTAP